MPETEIPPAVRVDFYLLTAPNRKGRLFGESIGGTRNFSTIKGPLHERSGPLIYLIEMSLEKFTYRHIAKCLAHISRCAKLVSGKIINIGLSLPFAHIYVTVVTA